MPISPSCISYASDIPHVSTELLSSRKRQGFRPARFSPAAKTFNGCCDLAAFSTREVAIDSGKYKRKSSGPSPIHHKPAKEALSSVGNLDYIISQLGPDADVTTYASLLRLCSLERALSVGERVHQHMVKYGYVDIRLLNNLLVQMYGKCRCLQHARAVFGSMVYRDVYSWTIMLVVFAQNGSLDDAKDVFAAMPQRDLVSWNAMITVCAQNEHGMEALDLFDQMLEKGFEPNKITFICLLDACASMAVLQEGRNIHSKVVDNGWESDEMVGNALTNMYGKSGSVDDARAVFAEMPLRNLVSMNTMISVCAQNGHVKEALQVFDQLQAEGFEPNKITFTCVLDVYGSMAALTEGREIHASIVGNGWESDVVVGTALINMYGKCRSPNDASTIFNEMPQRDVVLWSARIAACVENGYGEEALQLFHQMQVEGFKPTKVTFSCILHACASMAALEESLEIHTSIVVNGWELDVAVGNALVNMYGKCGSPDDARAVFAEMSLRDTALWSTMIASCAQNGQGKQALELFDQMLAECFEPDEVTLICVLDACANIASLAKGQEIHATIVCNQWESYVVVGTALINMYGKCGSMDDARAVFVGMPFRTVVSWSAMIVVCAQNGHAKEALQLFGYMQAESIKPNEVTFTGILTACSHMGLLADGRQYFASMSQDHGLLPSLDHYVCMIDLLGRAGHLDKAEWLINSMPIEANASAWLSLLSCCRIHGDVERGVRAAKHVFDLDETIASPYVLLGNIHASAGGWDDVDKVVKAIIDKRVRKTPVPSFIEVSNVVKGYFEADSTRTRGAEVE